jgi:hypothetical protein
MAVPYLNAEGRPVVSGERWNRFLLQADYPGDPHSFVGQDVRQMEKVLICAHPVGEGMEWRRRAWAQLSTLENAKVLRCRDVIEESGWRYEILSAPPPMSLQEWIAAHRPGFDEIESLVRQLAAILTALHAEGLVHLNIRPETIHIEESESRLEFWLGGLGQVTLFDQPDLIPVEVDPFYAPPEAAGLTRHTPGPGLCAWDWWSLGRVVQQFILGKHVLGMLLDRDVSVSNPDLRMRAELLLQEKEPPGVRAGAVEQMTVEPAAIPLLRGLLTGAVDARWRNDSVQRWLSHDPVQDYYDLPRTARLWSYKGQVFTVHSAAEFFTRPENWATGADTLLNPEQPGTFAHFLSQTPAYRADWDRLCSVRELAGTPGWAELPEKARRALTVAAAWLVLSVAGGGRALFRVCGYAMDNTGLSNLLRNPGGEESVELFRALLNPAVVDFVASLEPAAGRTLQTVATRGGAALKTALGNGWLHPTDIPGHARLFALSLERASSLNERVATLTATYATSRHPELARMLTSRSLTLGESLLLAFTGQTPEQCGYVTHAEARNERYQLLKADADRISVMLGWVQLHELLRFARLWGAPWPVYAGVATAVIGAVALMSLSLTATILVAALLLLSRVWVWYSVWRYFRRAEPQGRPWHWRDGTARSAIEVARVAAGLDARAIAEARRQLATLRAGMTEFVAEARHAPPLPEAHWWDLMGAIGLATVVSFCALMYSVAQVNWSSGEAEPEEIATSPEPAQPTVIRSRLEHVDRSIPISEVEDPEGLLATGKYEVVDDGFGRRLRGPLQKWDTYAPPKVESLVVEARAPASPEQAAFAVVNATMALQPYLRDSVGVLLAVRVPTTRGVGLLLFNGKERRLLEREVLLVRGELTARTWYELEGRRVFYVGSALPMDATISLAPP